MNNPTSLWFLALSLALTAALSSEAKPAPQPENKIEIRQYGNDKVEVRVESSRPFPVVGAIAVLHIGKELCSISRYPTGDTGSLIFTMTLESFAKTKNADAIEVRYDPDSQGHWEFGKLDKKKVKKSATMTCARTIRAILTTRRA